MIRLKTFIVFISLLLSAGLAAQEFGSNVKGIESDEQPIVEKKSGFTPDVSVSLGTSFSSFGPGYNMFGNWIMPEFTLPVSKKFAVRAGIGYSSMFYSTPSGEGTLFQQNNMQYGTVYVSGIYAVNSKLTVAGTAYKTFDLAPGPREKLNPRALDFSNEGIMLNVGYEVNENFRFNVGFSYQRQNPYNTMYGPGGFYGSPSPFGSPGFLPAYGPGF